VAKEDNEIELEGTVKEVPRGKFLVEIDNQQETKTLVLCHLSGKLKKNFIRIVLGDRVKIALSPYDLSKGRIVYRMK
jgi:translation initiation factor IF-1